VVGLIVSCQLLYDVLPALLIFNQHHKTFKDEDRQTTQKLMRATIGFSSRDFTGVILNNDPKEKMMLPSQTRNSALNDPNPVNKTLDTQMDSSSKLIEKDKSTVKRLQTKTTDDTSTHLRTEQDVAHDRNEDSGSRISLNGEFQGPSDNEKNSKL